MKCFFTFAVATAFAVGMNATLWSQTGGAGSGGAGGASGSAGTSGTAGAAGATGTAGTNGAAGNAGIGAAGGTGGANVAGTGNAGTAGSTPGAVNRVAPGNVGTASGPRSAGAAGQGNVNNRAMNANAPARNGQDFQFPNQTPFFNDAGVRQQLNLNDSQFNTLNTNYQTAYARYNQAVNNLSPGLTPEQREVQTQRLQQQFNQGLADLSGNTFTNPQTRTRFNQLNRQFMGPNAFNDPSVRQQLNLSPAQIRQLRTLQGNWRQQMQQFRQNAGQDANGTNNPQWTQFQQQYASSLNSILTAEQQQMWSQQVGQQFPITPNSFGNQPLPDGNVANVNANPPVGTVVPRGQVNAGAGTTTQGTQVQPRTQTQTGTQPATQGTAAPATASGTSSQGGTVR